MGASPSAREPASPCLQHLLRLCLPICPSSPALRTPAVPLLTATAVRQRLSQRWLFHLVPAGHWKTRLVKAEGVPAAGAQP